MKDIDLHVGYDPAASKARVLDAIRRAEAGPIEPESHVTFESWDGLSRARSAETTSASMKMWQSWRPPGCSIGLGPVASARPMTKSGR
jgi:hypothetical protein